MGAPDDDNDDCDFLFSESFEECSITLLLDPLASSETCDDADGKKQLRKAENMAIWSVWTWLSKVETDGK
ncbi:hypothetical protein ACFX2I_028602 [Malus domestica]